MIQERCQNSGSVELCDHLVPSHSIYANALFVGVSNYFEKDLPASSSSTLSLNIATVFSSGQSAGLAGNLGKRIPDFEISGAAEHQGYNNGFGGKVFLFGNSFVKEGQPHKKSLVLRSSFKLQGFPEGPCDNPLCSISLNCPAHGRFLNL